MSAHYGVAYLISGIRQVSSGLVAAARQRAGQGRGERNQPNTTFPSHRNNSTAMISNGDFSMVVEWICVGVRYSRKNHLHTRTYVWQCPINSLAS